MGKKITGILIICCFLFGRAAGQCTALGQNPETAFPVCGTTTFNQDQVPICSSADLYVPGCSGAGAADYQNRNPFWYKFTCFASGTLGFLVTPINLGDDYDWQLYDITGFSPNDVYTNPSLVVTGNWAGTFGVTGASASGVNYIQCASDPADNKPSFAQMPTLILGHNYLLLISHFTTSQSGYSLSFGGGTANITDPKLPHLASAEALCDGANLKVTLNKPMKCNSVSADGSEFTISPPLAHVIATAGIGCGTGFDMDAVQLTLDTPLPPGDYTVTIKDGADGNTLLDNCDRNIPVGESLPMTVYPIVPTPFDSVNKVGCAPDKLIFVFRKNIKCNSVAADGSDFIVTGPVPVTVTGASGNCNADGTSPTITIQLAAPIQVKGVFKITLVNGSDANTLIDECAQQTPAGEFVTVTTKDTVNADFSYNIHYGCKSDTIDYVHNGANEVNIWKWSFDNVRRSTVQSPVILYGSFGLKQTQLIVSNGTCTDTSSASILLDNSLKAAFEATDIVCPGDLAVFKDNSTGNILQWQWIFDNGNTSFLQAPPSQVYAPAAKDRDVHPMLIVTNNYGCTDTATQAIKVPDNCYIAVPNAFTPNGDGLNDYLYPLNAYKAVDLTFRVYNRFGELIFSTTDWTKKWDGSFKGQGADPGTYVWILQYTNRDTGKRVEQKGSTILIR